MLFETAPGFRPYLRAMTSNERRLRSPLRSLRSVGAIRRRLLVVIAWLGGAGRLDGVDCSHESAPTRVSGSSRSAQSLQYPMCGTWPGWNLASQMRVKHSTAVPASIGVVFAIKEQSSQSQYRVWALQSLLSGKQFPRNHPLLRRGEGLRSSPAPSHTTHRRAVRISATVMGGRHSQSAQEQETTHHAIGSIPGPPPRHSRWAGTFSRTKRGTRALYSSLEQRSSRILKQRPPSCGWCPISWGPLSRISSVWLWWHCRAGDVSCVQENSGHSASARKA